MLRSTNVTFPRRNSFPVPKMVTIGESMMTEEERSTETLPVPTHGVYVCWAATASKEEFLPNEPF